MSLPDRAECCYTSHYCEENVWKLCHYVRESTPDDLHRFFAVFISNPAQKIPLWKQKAGVEGEDNLVVWDYHVILIRKSDPCPLVYDHDTLLPFPCPFPQYWRQGIRPDALLLSDFHRHFRVIAAAEFLLTFASDRSHMRDPVDGSWLKPPPHWPCIQTPHSGNNLHSFICMSNTCSECSSHPPLGTIFQTSESLCEYFTGHRTSNHDHHHHHQVQEGGEESNDESGKERDAIGK